MVPVPGDGGPAGSGAAAVTAQAMPNTTTRARHAAAAAAARKPVKAVPAIAFSPKTVMLACALVGVPLLIVLVKIGPVRAMDQWKDLEPAIRDYTYDVVRTVCMEQYKGIVFDEFMRPPKVTNVMIDGPIMMFTLPNEVPIQGTSTEGHFRGTYFTREKRFEIDINVGGDFQTIKVESHVDDNGRSVIDKETPISPIPPASRPAVPKSR